MNPLYLLYYNSHNWPHPEAPSTTVLPQSNRNWHHWLQTNCQQLTAGVQCKTAELNFDESWTSCLLCSLYSLHRYKHRTDFLLCCQTRKPLTDNSAAQFPKNCAVPSPLANKEHLMNSAYAYYLYKCLLKETNEGAELKRRKLNDGIKKNQTWKINKYWNLSWSNLIFFYCYLCVFLVFLSKHHSFRLRHCLTDLWKEIVFVMWRRSLKPQLHEGESMASQHGVG